MQREKSLRSSRRGKRQDNSATKPLDETATFHGSGAPRGLGDRVVRLPIGQLKTYPGNPRRHPEVQIAALMKSIELAWTVPILIDETQTILAGHGRLEAAKRLGLPTVPTIEIRGLTANEKKAVVISDNKLPERAFWDFEVLGGLFKELLAANFEVELSGFSTGEVDIVIDGHPSQSGVDPADQFVAPNSNVPPISKIGDVWQLGPHKLICGDALQDDTYKRLLGREVAQMVVADVPFNVKISGHAMGRGKIRHREFVMGSGELTDDDYTKFLRTFASHCAGVSVDGAIHYIFTDWRHIKNLLEAACPVFSEYKNLLVWNKSNGGQGTFYRSKYELIGVFKSGTARHVNNFGLGAQGRYRTNVLDYPGVNSFDPSRRGDLALHPTVKPVALIADLMRDCSRRNGIVLDPFGGSGTAIMAAERTGRVARVIELDRLYVDTAIRRWKQTSGTDAMHIASGKSFAEIEAKSQDR